MSNENRLGKFLYPGIYKEGKGGSDPLPERGIRLFTFLLGTYFWKLISLNLLTIVLSIPVFTIPASLAALSRVMMKLALQGYCLVYYEYFSEWKSSLVRYIPFFLATAIPAAGGAAIIYSHIETLSGIGGVMLLFCCISIFLYIYLLWCYAFPLFSTVNLTVVQNIRNACYFIATQKAANLKLMLPLVINAFFFMFLPWTFPVFLLFLTSLSALIVCCIVKPPIYENVILPYVKIKNKSASSDNEHGK